MKKSLSLTVIGLLCGFVALPETLDFDKIEHWAGEGPHRAAMVVQFDAAPDINPGAIVWGYRWADGEEATTEAMMRGIAAASDDLILLAQQTGPMGHTLNGIGYGPSAAAMLAALRFDFASAAEDGRISFGYFTPNNGMGQTSAPGQEAENLAADAIADAAQSHVVEHPLSQEAYGYPAYDYDHWLMDDTDRSIWQSGWYDGYWSFWTGDRDMDGLSYSGMGMSSVELVDGEVCAWKFMPIGDSGHADGVTGASTPWLPLNYSHFSGHTDGVATETVNDDKAVYYRLDGTVAAEADAGTAADVAPGVYIVRRGSETYKVFIH